MNLLKIIFINYLTNQKINYMSNILKRIFFMEVSKFKINYSKLNPRHWKRPSFKKIVRFFVILVIFLGAFIIIKEEVMYQFSWGVYSDSDYYADEDYSGSSGECNTLGIELHGNIVTYITPDSFNQEGNLIYDESASQDIVAALENAVINEEIKAIILEIDSYGGSPVAAEEIEQAIKRVNKPIVVLVRDGATSAAYWVASGADIIFASAMSDVGSIGVTFSYLDNYQKNTKEGLTYNSLSTGKFKDYGDPDKPLTNEERKLIMRDLNIIYDKFIETVATNRNLDINKVKLLADGSSMPGQMALENGLIDRIGGMTEVKEYLKEKIGEEVDVCW